MHWLIICHLVYALIIKNTNFSSVSGAFNSCLNLEQGLHQVMLLLLDLAWFRYGLKNTIQIVFFSPVEILILFVMRSSHQRGDSEIFRLLPLELLHGWLTKQAVGFYSSWVWEKLCSKLELVYMPFDMNEGNWLNPCFRCLPLEWLLAS